MTEYNHLTQLPGDHNMVPAPPINKYDIPNGVLAEYEGAVSRLSTSEIDQINYDRRRAEANIHTGTYHHLIDATPEKFIADLRNTFQDDSSMEGNFQRALDGGIMERFSVAYPPGLASTLSQFIHNSALGLTANELAAKRLSPDGQAIDGSFADPHSYTNARNRSIRADIGGWKEKAQFFVEEAEAWSGYANITTRQVMSERVVNSLLMALACEHFSRTPPPPLPSVESLQAPVVESKPPSNRRMRDLGSRLLTFLHIKRP